MARRGRKPKFLTRHDNKQAFPLRPRYRFAYPTKDKLISLPLNDHFQAGIKANEMLQRFDIATNKADKLRIKRATINAMNHAKARSQNTMLTERERKEAEKAWLEYHNSQLNMSLDPVKDEEALFIPKQKEGKYGIAGQPVVRKAPIDNTTFWVGQDVYPLAEKEIRASYDRLPLSARAQVSNVEIYTHEGPNFKVGQNSFQTGAHWDKESQTVRVFHANNGAINRKNTESLIPHEVGHALWDKVSKKAWDEPYPHAEAEKIWAKNSQERKEARNKIYDKYEPKMEELQKEQYELSKKIFSIDLTQAQQEKARERSREVRDELKALEKQREKELNNVKRRTNEEAKIEKLLGEVQPVLKRKIAFEEATNKEGGLTNYSEAYRKVNAPTKYTENFAEAMAIWYGSEYNPDESNQKAKNFPATYKAFMNIITAEAPHHSVPLSKRPEGALEAGAKRRQWLIEKEQMDESIWGKLLKEKN